jgi:peptidyl-prolyl cis-trans isomerase NIMA-interacting 1
MSKALPFLALIVPFVIACCDGTLTGIGREPRPPETSLPPAPVESVTPRAAGSGVPIAGEDQTEYIVAQHLLVMYAGSKSAPSHIKRTKEEARLRASEALNLVKKGQDFDKVVAAYTDEPGGAAKHGDLGRFSRDMMVKSFSDAAFALDVGQVSTVIESPFGFHVIRRNQ